DPGATAAAFVPNPHVPGDRIYRTGDRARWMADGTLEFLGRGDSQVKIRGFRIEPGEIENVLAAHPGVQEALVLVHSDGSAGKRLIAYVQPTPGTPADDEAWTEFLRRKLPDYMIPSAFVCVERFPLNAHNKIDRAALRALGNARPRAEGAYQAPRTPVEE